MAFGFLQEQSLIPKLRLGFWIIIIIGVILVFVVLIRGQELIIRTPEAYQAVFLDNGQVYFGKLKAVNRDWWSLTDIYYLRAGTIQQGALGEDQARDVPTLSQLDLIKLGAELHAPKDEMIINKTHVIFYEEISENGEVMKLIRKHKQGI